MVLEDVKYDPIASLRHLLDLCIEKGVKRIKHGEIEAEFFPKASEPMALDPLALSKVLMDSMPDDQAMLFAATEGIPEPAEEENKV